MSQQDFTISILVEQTPQEVFNAINNVRGWWAEDMEGNTSKLNDEFIYHYKDVHRCKIRLIEVLPDKKVTWLVVDNHFNFTQDKSEWIDTKISFEIVQKEGKTQLVFTHLGLVPDYQCYQVCFDAWSNYINNSLRSLINVGKGQPNAKEGGFNSQLVEKWQLQG